MSKKDKIYHKKVKGTEMVFSTLSLPASLVEELKILKRSYEIVWGEGGKYRVTYEKIFERLLSKSGLGHVDPDVWSAFNLSKSIEFFETDGPEVVTRPTKPKRNVARPTHDTQE